MIRRAGVGEVPLLNAIMERDWGGGDVSPFMSEPQNVALVTDQADMGLFAYRGPGIYEAHISYRAKGADAIRLGRDMMAHMHDHYGCRLMWSRVPVASRKVHFFVRRLGWKSHGVERTAEGPCEIYSTKELTCLQQ